MKRYETVEYPATRKKVQTGRICDLCGVESKHFDWGGGGMYDINETEVKIEIRQKEGFSCPDGGDGTEYEIDLCPKCFKERLVSWLRSQGANVKELEWEW